MKQRKKLKNNNDTEKSSYNMWDFFTDFNFVIAVIGVGMILLIKMCGGNTEGAF